jgi:PAS domain S-box-containing protein
MGILSELLSQGSPYMFEPGHMPFAQTNSIARALSAFGAFCVTGLFASELARNRRLVAEHVAELQQQVALRRGAQEELEIIVNTSPAAIILAGSDGRILSANGSARLMLGFDDEALNGERISDYLPALDTVPRASAGNRTFSSSLECRGRRKDGALFLAQAWVSTYASSDGPRLAAIVLDASESLRDREGGGLRALMLTSRILVGAVSHSVRNLCAAARVAYANLQRSESLTRDPDFQALGTMIRGLESIASAELHRSADRHSSTLDLSTLLDELRILIEPSFDEAGIAAEWHVFDDLPLVTGEHYGVLHALLNVVQNAARALGHREQPRVCRLIARKTAEGVEIRVEDNAGGVPNPSALFQPFGAGEGAGLGLYVARAILRSFDGEIRYERISEGSAFIMDLNNAHLFEHASKSTN